MPISRRPYKSIPEDSDQSEDIPLRTVNEKPLRNICKCPDFDGQPGHKEKLQASHPRFGPFYREDESEVSGKKDAWDKILEKSVDKKKTLEDKKKTLEARNKTIESYLFAMRTIEKEARNAYGDKALHTLTESEFRWLMIKDGCFFLQLALFILGVSSKQLGYPDKHIIFGKKLDKKQKKDDIKRWIKSMFFVGNQIPLVVLNELMKQTFFQNILKEYINSWNVPSEVSKRILYELLVLPAIEYSKQGASPAPIKGFGGKGNWLEEQHPSDLLHALHCLMFGSRGRLRRGLIQDETGDDDLESGSNIESKDGDDDLESGPNMESKDINFSATKLQKKGIRFGKLEQMGCREIKFTNYILFARLYLPTFAVDDDTEALWKSLKYYEMTQQQGNGNCEVRSYLQFMNDLICTDEDVRLLAKKGIIMENSSCDKYELPIMLRKLAGKEKITTPNHHLLRIRLRDYSLAPWERFKIVAILAFIFTVVQAFFAVFAYFRPTSQK